MTEEEMKDIEIGTRFKYSYMQGVWEVVEKVERGLVAVGYRSRSHKHLVEWSQAEEIEHV